MKIRPTEKISLIDLLMKEFRDASRSSVKKMIQHGNLKVNGKTVTNPVTLLDPGDEAEYTRYRMTANTQGSPFPVLFEDEYLIFVEKPAGLLTYGERGTVGTSVYREVLGYLQERSKGKERIFVVHRLDKEVSGILLFAKSEEIQQKIKENWKETEKLYYALVEGRPRIPEDTLRHWLKETNTQKMYITQESPESKLAVTQYRTLKEMESHTFLEIRIETGRKNQIRVQLAAIGCPIVGDRKYGSRDKYKRQIRLHAFSFSFSHPVTGEPLKIESRLPHSFLKLNEKDEHYK